MKIAFTADIHLRSKDEYPERFNALINILDQLLTENINTLIVAGDLFDAKGQNYSEFDDLCKQNRYNNIKIYIIPGNHDLTISSQQFIANNIEILNRPQLLQFDSDSIDLLFIPYMIDKSMGEVIANYRHKLANRWILIGHGDYLGGRRDPNPYEPGIYMPLTRNDLDFYKPNKVILGHIHKKMDLGKIHYVGSPCGLDITETGRRRFIILDTQNLNVTSRVVDTDYIYFNETLITLPISNESGYIKKGLQEIIKKWNLSEKEIPKSKIRLIVKGYSSNKSRLYSIIKEELKDISFYKDENPDLTGVYVFEDPERIQIVEKVKTEIDEMNLNNINNSTKADILEEALHIILKH